MIAILMYIGLAYFGLESLIFHPQLESWLEYRLQTQDPLWIEGRLRKAKPPETHLQLNLADVVLSGTGSSRFVGELEVTLEGSKIRRINVYHGRLFHIHGRLKDYRDTARRWQVYLKEWGVALQI